jgi:multiple sugar transport system permease protein
MRWTTVRKQLWGIFFILPWLIGFLAFQLGPLVTSFVMTFMQYDIIRPPSYIGLENYVKMFDDPLTWKALVNTFSFVIGSVPSRIVVALAAALLLNRKMRGTTFFRTVYYLPTVTSGVAIAMLWRWIYQPSYGLINSILGYLGIAGPGWLGSPQWALPAMVIMTVWQSTGTLMVIYLAGLQGIPEYLYEAAALDGAGGWQVFRHITVPMLSPTIFFTIVYSVIQCFQSLFTYIFMMTGGGPMYATYVLVYHIYKNAFEYFKMGYASALAWLLFIIVFVLTMLQFKLSTWVHYES